MKEKYKDVNDAIKQKLAKNLINGLSQIDYVVKIEKTTKDHIWDQIIDFHKQIAWKRHHQDEAALEDALVDIERQFNVF